MADNVAITAGSGTSIATDDVSSVHFQKVKLDAGADGATAPVTTSAGLPVDLRQLAGNSLSAGNGASGTGVLRVTVANDSTGIIALTAGEAHAGEVGLAYANPTSTLTRPANTTAYAVDDLIADNTTAGSIVVPSFTATRAAARGGRVSGVRLSTNKTSGWGSVSVLVRLWDTAATYTNGDNGAYAVATGAANYLCSALITLEQWADGAVGTAAFVELAELIFKKSSGSSIYWDMQIKTAATPASGQTFTLTLLTEQN